MCEKSSACGCSGHAPSGVGSAPVWAPLWVVGAAIAVVLVVKTAEVVWPYAVAGASLIAAWKVAPPVTRFALWLHRRRRLARMIPAPDPMVVAAPARTVVTSATVRPVSRPDRLGIPLRRADRTRT